jgi:hypothetical protein
MRDHTKLRAFELADELTFSLQPNNLFIQDLCKNE